MITKEQIESGCEIWCAFESSRNVCLSKFSAFGKSLVLKYPNNYFASKHEAELFILRCKLNDN